jgi:hypothetical protein
MHAVGPVPIQAKQDGGPHKVEWTGHTLVPCVTLECRVVIRGVSLEKDGYEVSGDVTLLPVPAENSYVEVAVILGPKGPTTGFPREKDVDTRLLSEGRLSDDRRIWVVYVTKPIEPANEGMFREVRANVKAYVDPQADVERPDLRAIGAGKQSDGSLTLWDLKANWKRQS